MSKRRDAETPIDDNDYVEHPRFGRGPRVTGLNPHQDFDAGVFLHWRCEGRIPGTAVAADLKRQVPATVGINFYFDERRTCVDCQRPFIFFALEQKHWYEELKLPLEADCIRCVPCRKTARHARERRLQLERRYTQLLHSSNRSLDESLELAEACLTLIEEGHFSPKSIQRVRMLLNQTATTEQVDRRLSIEERVRNAESGPSRWRSSEQRRLEQIIQWLTTDGLIERTSDDDGLDESYVWTDLAEQTIPGAKAGVIVGRFDSPDSVITDLSAYDELMDPRLDDADD